MLFPDPSCLAENTLNRHLGLGLFNLMQPDWVGIVVLTQTRKIHIDGKVNFASIDEGAVLSLLHGLMEPVLADFRAEHLTVGGCDCIIIPIRSTVKYNVFYFYVKQEVRFQARDFEWIQIYTKLSYANTLLNNEVAQDRAYIENVFDSTESAILAMDLDGRVVAANNAVASIFGLSGVDLVGKNYFEYIPQDKRSVFVGAVARVCETQSRQPLEEVLFDTQTEARILNLVLSPLINSKNKLAGIVLVGTDITERRLIEHELEQSRQFGLLGEVAAGIAHDVKNPLMNIRGCARIMERNEQLGPAQKQMLGIIVHEVDRIDGVIEQIMSFGNLSKTGSDSRVSINEVLEDCVRIINRQSIGKDIDIFCQFDRELPCVQADVRRIQQMFFNVLLNALQAIAERGTIFLSTHYLTSSQQAEVIIRDNGVGIRKADLTRIFSPYFTTKDSGTGLGLFLVKRFLEQYGATLRIDSTVGVGTEITMVFPIPQEVFHGC